VQAASPLPSALQGSRPGATRRGSPRRRPADWLARPSFLPERHPPASLRCIPISLRAKATRRPWAAPSPMCQPCCWKMPTRRHLPAGCFDAEMALQRPAQRLGTGCAIRSSGVGCSPQMVFSLKVGLDFRGRRGPSYCSKNHETSYCHLRCNTDER
jgi:hypothetical protein